MKRILIALASVGILATGCTNKEQENQIISLNQQKDSLLTSSQEKDRSIDEFISEFEEIEGNLVQISAKQKEITRESIENPEFSNSIKDRINQEIALIDQLMEESKSKIASLDKKLRNSNSRISKFRKMVASLNNQVAVKDSEMVVLNNQVLALNEQVENLNLAVNDLQLKDSVNAEFIHLQTDEMNKAYIAVGPSKALREKKVIANKGGFLGLGKEQKLSENLDSESFTQIDIRNIASIPLETKEAKLVTVHPLDSYEIETDNKKSSELKITDPDKFWSTSKYLVVMTD